TVRGVVRKEFGRRETLLQILEDRDRLGDHEIAVFEDRHLPEGIQAEEFGAAMGAARKIDLDLLVGDGFLTERDPDTTRDDGERRQVGLHGESWVISWGVCQERPEWPLPRKTRKRSCESSAPCASSETSTRCSTTSPTTPSITTCRWKRSPG